MLGMLSRLRRLTDSVIANPFLMWAGFVALMAAFVVGTVGWYGDFFEQLRIPLWAYPFVPDCPLAAGLAGVALILRHLKRPSRIVDQVAAVACIKYGTWTMTFWALYWAGNGPIEMSSLFSGPVMFVTHLGLTVLGLVLLLYVGRPKLGEALLVLAFFALSDFVDYASIAPQRFGGYGYYPPLPPVNGNYFGLVPAMQIHAIVMTWGVAGGQALRAVRGRQNPQRAT